MKNGVTSTNNTWQKIDQSLTAHLEVFLRRWGDVEWRALVGEVGPTDDEEVIALVRAVAAIEDDAFYIQTKLKHGRILRSGAIRQYNSVWLTEEADHGRAFGALAGRLGVEGAMIDPSRHGTLVRDRRAIMAVPALRLASVHRRGVLAGYAVRGALVEHVAIAVYGSLMRRLRLLGEETGAEIVRRILVQEGRHLRFFTQSAKTLLEGSPHTALLIRRVTEATWRPPGVDLYGRAAWVEAFSPVLRDDRFLHELVDIDRRVAELPAFGGSRIVEGYVRGILANGVRSG
jgi:hypothetical protein